MNTIDPNTITTNTITTNTITTSNHMNPCYHVSIPYPTYTYDFDWGKNYTPLVTTSSITLTSDNLIKDGNSFKDIIQYQKHKVYKFIFIDGTEVKTIRSDKDPFSLEYAFYLALAKKLYGKEYTFDGVLKKAEELPYLKRYNKIVKDGLKLFKKKQQEEEKKEKEEQLKKEQYQRLIEKKKKRDQKRKEQKRNDLIDAIAYGIKRSNSDFIDEYEEKLYSKKKKKQRG